MLVNICMEQPTITLADIASMVAIIEAASTRGAIRANELTSVGDLYNRLQQFMAHAQAQVEQAQATQSEANPAQGEADA